MVAAISFGYDVFAVQDGGQCFSGANAGTAYKTEKSRDCDGLKGGPMANDVFIISKFLSLSTMKYQEKLYQRNCDYLKYSTVFFYYNKVR